MLLYQNGEKFTFEFTIHQDWPSLLWIHSTTTEICAGHDLKKPLVTMVSSGGPTPWIWHGMFFRKFGSNWSPNPMLKQTIITIITMIATNNITIIAIIANIITIVTIIMQKWRNCWVHMVHWCSHDLDPAPPPEPLKRRSTTPDPLAKDVSEIYK